MATLADTVSLARPQLPSLSAVRVDMCGCGAPRQPASLAAGCGLVAGRTLKRAAGTCSTRVREPVRPLISAHVGPLLDHPTTLVPAAGESSPAGHRCNYPASTPWNFTRCGSRPDSSPRYVDRIVSIFLLSVLRVTRVTKRLPVAQSYWQH